MVLHNDKWKNKAKRDYMRKHGLLKKKTDTKESDSNNNSDEGDFNNTPSSNTLQPPPEDEEELAQIEKKTKEDESKKQTTNSQEVPDPDSSTVNTYRRKKKLQNNSWRFKSDIPDEADVIVDPEILEQQRLQREEEKRIQQENSNIVLQSLENGEEKDYTTTGKKKSANEMTRDDLLNWSLDDDTPIVRQNRGLKAKNTVRTLTEDEKKKYFEMQREVNHMKMVDSAKNKFNPRANEFKGKSKVLELNMNSDSDKYRDALELTFEQNRQTSVYSDEANFEKNLEDVLGIKLNDDSEKKVDSLNFDLNNLIVGGESKSKSKAKPRKADMTSRATDTTTKKKTAVKVVPPPDTTGIEDDFLDELLG
ncbi:unnamed protein product [Ambrosiozyma monospora]|uniref:Unnamed protein product n=1 Tax=Ambrosiozyma monospora TaxID=43982 RepID=A0A9W7DG17_AMBMO|nr:unnamed protein product [Ambrosiozyma monospora]